MGGGAARRCGLLKGMYGKTKTDNTLYIVYVCAWIYNMPHLIRDHRYSLFPHVLYIVVYVDCSLSGQSSQHHIKSYKCSSTTHSSADDDDRWGKIHIKII